MKSIYDNYIFQKSHSYNHDLISSNIDGLIHTSKIIKSNIKDIYYCETPWGYSYPYFKSQLNKMELWKEWSKYCLKNNIIAEIIKIPPFFDFSNLDTSIFDEVHLISRTCAFKFIEADFYKEFKKKTRYIIKKAESNLIYRKAEISDSIHIFNLYEERMKNIKAKKKYFLDLGTFDYLCNQQNSSIYLAYKGDLFVGFVCFLFDNEISHYHLSACNQIGRNFNANYLLLYLALKESFERGIKLVHYGGGLTNSVDDPLFKFKKKFSNTFLDYRMALSIHNKELFIKYRNASSNRIIDFKVP